MNGGRKITITGERGRGMKRIAIPLALTLALAGCGTATKSDTGNGLMVRESAYQLKDGRTVTCLIHTRYDAMSCDWEAAK